MSALSDQFSFNLVDEPWIPVLAPGGASAGDVSLRDVFARAHQFQEISTSSPLTTISLYRVLIALIHAATDGPESVADWRDLWDRGCFDQEQIGGYLDRWNERFDLFHPRHPFYQRADLEADYAKWIVQIVPELPVDGGAVFFDHVTPATLPPFTPAQAARALVTIQTFATPGLITLRKGEDPKYFKSADASPLMKCAVTLVRGGNLFETLLLNLHRYSRRDSEPMPVMNGDRPAWEWDEPTDAEDRFPEGYRHLLTWQSRRARLIPERLSSGAVGVSRAVLMKGNQFPDSFDHVTGERMAPFRKNNDPKARSDGWFPLTIRSNRALWRDSAAIFQQYGSARDDAPVSLKRPGMFDWLADLENEGGLPVRATSFDVEVFGIESDRANLSAWRQETLPIRHQYLVEPYLTVQVQRALDLAERVHGVLQAAVERYAELALAPMSDSGGRKADRAKGVTPLRDAIDAGAAYWPFLEAPFLDLLERLPDDQMEDDDGELLVGQSRLIEWRDDVEQIACRALHEATAAGGTSARALKAAVAAEQRFEVLIGVVRTGFTERIKQL